MNPNIIQDETEVPAVTPTHMLKLADYRRFHGTDADAFKSAYRAAHAICDGDPSAVVGIKLQDGTCHIDMLKVSPHWQRIIVQAANAEETSSVVREIRFKVDNGEPDERRPLQLKIGDAIWLAACASMAVAAWVGGYDLYRSGHTFVGPAITLIGCSLACTIGVATMRGMRSEEP